MIGMLLLLLEDDQALSEALSDILRQAGHEVVTCSDGHKALRLVQDRPFELCVLDLGLPGMDGLEVLRAMRNRRVDLPVLVITARDRLAERIVGLDSGADDYLVKPFEIAEFEARVRALLRRRRVDRGDLVRVGKLQFVPGEPLAILGGQSLELGPGELILLELLTRPAGRVVSKERIASRLTKNGLRPTDAAVEVAVHRLRRKLAPGGLVVRALRGFGYLLEVNDGD